MTRLTPCHKIWLPFVVDNLRQECPYKSFIQCLIQGNSMNITQDKKHNGVTILIHNFVANQLLLTNWCYSRMNLSMIQPPKWRCWNHETSYCNLESVSQIFVLRCQRWPRQVGQAESLVRIELRQRASNQMEFFLAKLQEFSALIVTITRSRNVSRANELGLFMAKRILQP